MLNREALIEKRLLILLPLNLKLHNILLLLAVQNIQGIDKRRKLGMPEITHVKIREPLSQLVAQLRRQNPFVIIGALLHKGQYRPFNHFQVCRGS